jgi:hypothetical protein
MLTFNITKKTEIASIKKASDYSMSVAKKLHSPFAILLTEVTETTKNDGHQVIPGRRILIYQNPLFERIKTSETTYFKLFGCRTILPK